MNREIKFRVWSKASKTFEPFFTHELDDPHGIKEYFDCPSACFQESLKDSLQDNNIVIQQFTGLLDKNGQEVYEGDLIKYKEKMHEHGDVQFLKGQVVYDAGRAAFGIAGTQSGEIWNYFTDMVISDFEVVGNVFEVKND